MIPRPDKPPGFYWVLHWASLLAGARRAWIRDKKKENACVQLSIKQGLSNVKVFHMKTPAIICIYLKDLGNTFNDAATRVTFLEVVRSVENCEAGWIRKKTVMSWTVNGLGQPEYEKKRLTYFNSVHPQRWKSYVSLERAVSIFKTFIKNKVVPVFKDRSFFR